MQCAGTDELFKVEPWEQSCISGASALRFPGCFSPWKTPLWADPSRTCSVLRGAVGSASSGAQLEGGRAVLPSPVWHRASSASFAALSSCSTTQARLGSSGRNLGVAGAVSLEPLLCPGLCAHSGLCKGREKAAGEHLPLTEAGAWRCSQKQTPAAGAPLLGLRALPCPPRADS